MSTAGSWRKNSEVFDERAREYDSWFDDSLLFAIETAAIRALPIHLREPALEIGVGPGRFGEALDSGFGIDPAMAPLQIAATRGIAVCQAIGEALPFAGRSYARVSIFFTLCFVQDPAKVLAEAHRVLQESGHLILGFVPSTGKWGATLQQKKESGHLFYEHARFFSIKDINALLADQGFTVSSAVSSLYQDPGEVTQQEAAQAGMDEKAGFVALAAIKN
ncbi:MAG: class I SAM-dependent methyltransferase [Desulfocapsa sp.]|nr:class I SAM-dependent methyltransferase [Desulfocapsa sp.]